MGLPGLELQVQPFELLLGQQQLVPGSPRTCLQAPLCSEPKRPAFRKTLSKEKKNSGVFSASWQVCKRPNIGDNPEH